MLEIWVTESLIYTWLLVPPALGGILHMGVVKLNWFEMFSRPISIALFGKNKTWRGLLVMPISCLIGVYCLKFLVLGLNPETSFRTEFLTPLLGLMLGLAYALFELPNSYLKRRVGIEPGKLPDKNRFLFFLLDHLDSASGCLLIYAYMLDLSLGVLIYLLAIGPVIHTLINLILYALRIRKEAF